MEHKEEFYSKLKHDKVKMNWNKNPIEIKTLLSFITIELERSLNHLGSDMGWTEHFNKEYNLIIRGGWVNGKEYLDTLQFGKNLDNPYNNYVNPFYLADIMTIEGKRFFMDYYKEEIDLILQMNLKNIEFLTKQLEEAKKFKKITTNSINNFIK